MSSGKKLTPQERARIRHLRAQGLSVALIAKRVGRNETTVYKALR